jgi:LCP family protein required for cell wall assembly
VTSPSHSSHGPSASTSETPARGPAHARRLGGHRLARAVALVLTAALAFVGVGAATALTRLQGNITSADVDDLLGDRPAQPTPDPDDPNKGKPLNILLMGSDDRGGDNAGFAVEGVTGMRSDTTIVLHISADRSRVELVSIPRDSRVDIPSCTMTNGKTTTPRNERFNAAFALGAVTGGDVPSAAACAINTVESLTDLYIDDFVVVDFAGFQKMIDAIGGVQICIPNDIDAPKADLQLTAGEQTLDGVTALGYARARTGVGLGNGSDLQRIDRQQKLLAATVHQVLSKNLLTDAPALYQFLEAGTASLTTSTDLGNLSNLTGLAFSLRGLSSGNITFMTVPYAPDPTNPNTVVWAPEAAEVWANIKADLPLEGESAGSSTDTPAAGGTAADGAPADAVSTTGTGTGTPDTTGTKAPGKDALTSDDLTAVC